ncbi:MAG: hypothetical protein QOI80_274 [Solirubrobacteraceae bacterium]|jgi:hypothetical protein|nr:hypothetical protein [Solirubrobacteraceae bacterium]
MGMLDDAIREHLELKRRAGAAEDEVSKLENEAFGSARREAPVIAEPVDQLGASELPPPPEEAPAPAPEATAPAPAPASAPESDSWLEDDEVDAVPEVPSATGPAQSTSEFTAREASEATGGAPASDYVAPDEEGDDLLEETPDFLQETPEHDRLWFEQKPPRDFEFDD